MFVVFHNIVRFKPVHSIVCSYDHRSPREAWLSNGSIPHRISSEVTSFRNEESQKSIYQSMAGGGAAGVNAGTRGDGGAGGDEGDEGNGSEGGGLFGEGGGKGKELNGSRSPPSIQAVKSTRVTVLHISIFTTWSLLDSDQDQRCAR
jgi:hypothetical protein